MNNIIEKQNNKDQPVYNIGYDFDGVASELPIPDEAIIVTGRYKKFSKEVYDKVGKRPVFFLPDNIEHTKELVAQHKADIINKYQIKRFYEDSHTISNILRDECPNCDIVQIEPNSLKYVVLTSEGTGFPIAHKLQNEGFEVYVGQAETFKELDMESTPEEDKKLKDSQVLYRGILKVYSASKLVKALEKVKNKDEYFIICDLNSLHVYAERLLKSGFTKGIFPTKEDYDFEKGREEAMKFVEDNYPDIKIIPFQKFSTVEEATQAVEESEVPMVIQSEGDFVSTICPCDDVEKNKSEILSALQKHAKDYSKGEIIIKEKLVQPVEITPQIVFYDGVPCFTDIDIETKNIGDGENNGNQVGCGSNLIISTDIEEKINKIAFPPIVYEMAKKHKGIFVWDISIYFTEKGLFFGEFCSNRFGYDACLTEMAMSGGANEFFVSLMNGKNPLKAKFGAATRVFNLNKVKDGEVKVEIPQDKNIWVYEVKYKDGQWVTLGVFWDLAVITGVGKTINESVDNVFNTLPSISFKEKYTRTQHDFLDIYPTSIIQRYNSVNGIYFDAPEVEDTIKNDDYEQKLSLAKNSLQSDYDNKVDKITKDHETKLQSVRDEIKSILNG